MTLWQFAIIGAVVGNVVWICKVQTRSENYTPLEYSVFLALSAAFFSGVGCGIGLLWNL